MWGRALYDARGKRCRNIPSDIAIGMDRAYPHRNGVINSPEAGRWLYSASGVAIHVYDPDYDERVCIDIEASTYGELLTILFIIENQIEEFEPIGWWIIGDTKKYYDLSPGVVCEVLGIIDESEYAEFWEEVEHLL